MPQNGLHGLIGLATAKAVVKRAPEGFRPAFAGAIVLGAMLPDIDMYPTAIAVLLKHKELTYVIHRSATHSLLAILLLVMFGFIIKGKGASWVLWGLSLGMATHVALDTLFWFAQIDMFWPFSHYPPEHPMLPIVNLWEGRTVSHVIVNIREACEFLAFALMFYCLWRIAKRPPAMKKMTLVAWAWFAVTLATAFVFKENEGMQNYFVTTPYLIFFLPFAWRQTWLLRHEIARWSAPS